MLHRILVLGVPALLFCGRALPQGGEHDSRPDLTVWPNAVSRANSDPWLARHHDAIRRLEPRLLILNFANGFTTRQATEKAEQLIAALAESSRCHGYEDPAAPVFLQYRIARLVDLTDPAPAPPTPDGNSTAYPRVPNWKDGINFVYRELYSESFARRYGFADPKRPGRWLPLNELVEQGLVHELWFFAYQRSAGSPYECTEQKPVHDEKLERVGQEHRHSGNGGDPDEPWFGRSLRITFVNAERGIGCALESLGHALEGTANSGVIPYFRKYFYEYADFELDQRDQLPVASLYAVDAGGKDKAAHPDPQTLIIHHRGKDYRVAPFVAAGGSVHFPPNARRDYDLDNPQAALSTIEHWRRRDGPGGKDRTIEFTPERFRRFRQLAPDCMGPWLVYWRQNMPGLGNRSLDDQRAPMKNWWVFLFY